MGSSGSAYRAISSVLALGASVLGNSPRSAASRRLPLNSSGRIIGFETGFETAFALVYGFAYETCWPHPLEVVAAIASIGRVGPSARRHA